MKFFIPFLSSLLLLGCTQESKPPKSALDTTPSSPVVAQIPTPPRETMAKVPTDGASLFAQQCASCHGAKGEKSALGKSRIIANLTQEEITNALKGYQSQSYGKEMKAIMEGKVKGLNEEQLGLLSNYISGH